MCVCDNVSKRFNAFSIQQGRAVCVLARVVMTDDASASTATWEPVN